MEEELVRVLLVDDDEDDYVLTRDLLAEAEGTRFNLEWMTTYEAALEAMERAQHHVTLVDYHLGERDGLELLHAAIALGCKAPIIMLTGRGDYAVDVAAMQAGAADYLVKNQLGAELLGRSIRYAIERKRAEAEREAARELLQATIDAVNEPIMLIGTDYQVKLVNQAVRDDYPVSKGTGPLYCYRVFHHRDTPCSGATHPCPLEQMRQSLRPVTVVHEHVRLDGEKRLVEIIASPLMGEDGTLTGIVESARDITESKRTEEALKEYSERLEEIVEERTRELRDAQEELVRKEKLAVLGQLAGGVGHELRNPLGAISNAIYFVNMALEEPESEVKEALEIMAKEVVTSEKIISSLLDFARAKPPTRRKVDVNDVLQAALSRISVPESVEVVSQLDESLPTILADPDQLTQVFGNIILNGIQAMTSSSSVETPEGGRLVVKTFKTSEVSEKLPRSEGVAVSFADTGVGIPEDNLDKLFEPLFTTKAKGIGLGLALVKTLVEGHRGSIEVQNAGGKGSTFTVRLPLDIERVVAVIERVREAR